MKTFSGAKAAQREDELKAFIKLLKEHKVKKYLEVGSRHGDSLHAIGMALGKGAEVVSIEMPFGPWGQKESEVNLDKAIEDLNNHERSASLILGDSKSNKVISAAKKIAPYDAILIDGDHSLEGVVLDWYNYQPLSRIIAFHDIAPNEKAIRKGVRVHLLWRELKAKYRHVQILGSQPGMGIGVVFLED